MNGVAVAVFDVAPGAVTLTAQVTCMLLVAFVLAWLGRRGSPGTLHLLWTTTFVLVLALPLLGLIGPSWEVPLLPTAADAPRPALSPGSSATPLADMVPVPLPDDTAMREALVPEELARLDAGFGGADGAPADVPTRHLVVRIAWIVWIVGVCSRWYRLPPPPYDCGDSWGPRALCAVESGRARPRSCGTGWASAAGYSSCPAQRLRRR